VSRVFIALGGNQGNRAVLLATALDVLWEFVVLVNRSPVYETAP
jgi:7,8-dihydro-6-hydroxymethylpterin-pyrophosphokinase